MRNRPKDWEFDESYDEYRKRKRIRARVAIQLERSPNRICSVCLRVVTSSKGWVVVNKPTSYGSKIKKSTNLSANSVQSSRDLSANSATNSGDLDDNLSGKNCDLSANPATNSGNLSGKNYNSDQSSRDLDDNLSGNSITENHLNSTKSAIKVRKLLENLLVILPEKRIVTRSKVQSALDSGILCRGCYMKLKSMEV